MSRKLPPCDHDECPPTHCQQPGSLDKSAGSALDDALALITVDPAAFCSAWWMYDNHTFQEVDVTEPNWRGYVMTFYDIDGYGSFFARESPNSKTIFALHGSGKEGRDAFAAALDAWNPPNAERTRGANNQ